MSLPLDSQAIQFTVYIRVTALAAKIKEKKSRSLSLEYTVRGIRIKYV